MNATPDQILTPADVGKLELEPPVHVPYVQRCALCREPARAGCSTCDGCGEHEDTVLRGYGVFAERTRREETEVIEKRKAASAAEAFRDAHIQRLTDDLAIMHELMGELLGDMKGTMR